MVRGRELLSCFFTDGLVGLHFVGTFGACNYVYYLLLNSKKLALIECYTRHRLNRFCNRLSLWGCGPLSGPAKKQWRNSAHCRESHGMESRDVTVTSRSIIDLSVASLSRLAGITLSGWPGRSRSSTCLWYRQIFSPD